MTVTAICAYYILLLYHVQSLSLHISSGNGSLNKLYRIYKRFISSFVCPKLDRTRYSLVLCSTKVPPPLCLFRTQWTFVFISIAGSVRNGILVDT